MDICIPGEIIADTPKVGRRKKIRQLKDSPKRHWQVKHKILIYKLPAFAKPGSVYGEMPLSALTRLVIRGGNIEHFFKTLCIICW